MQFSKTFLLLFYTLKWGIKKVIKSQNDCSLELILTCDVLVVTFSATNFPDNLDDQPGDTLRVWDHYSMVTVKCFLKNNGT